MRTRARHIHRTPIPHRHSSATCFSGKQQWETHQQNIHQKHALCCAATIRALTFTSRRLLFLLSLSALYRSISKFCGCIAIFTFINKPRIVPFVVGCWVHSRTRPQTRCWLFRAIENRSIPKYNFFFDIVLMDWLIEHSAYFLSFSIGTEARTASTRTNTHTHTFVAHTSLSKLLCDVDDKANPMTPF